MKVGGKLIELFVELKMSISRRAFEGVILKNIKNKITE